METITEDKSLSLSKLKDQFSLFGGHLELDGSIITSYKRMGIIVVSAFSEENSVQLNDQKNIWSTRSINEFAIDLGLIAMDAGARNVHIGSSNSFEIWCDESDLFTIMKKLKKSGFRIQFADWNYVSNETISNLTTIQRKNFTQLLIVLEKNNDIQKVYHNVMLQVSSQ